MAPVTFAPAGATTPCAEFLCYLGDMLSAAGGCELSTTTCKNRLEEVQGTATSSLFMPPFFQDTWCYVRAAMLLASETLTIDKTKPPTSAAEWQGNVQTDLQCQAARRCHHQVHWTTCSAWHWDLDRILKERRLRWYGRGMLQWCSRLSHTGWGKAWAWEACLTWL